MKNRTLKRNTLFVLFAITAGGSYQAHAEGPKTAVVPVGTKPIIATQKRFEKTKKILQVILPKFETAFAVADKKTINKKGFNKYILELNNKMKTKIQEIKKQFDAIITSGELSERHCQKLKQILEELITTLNSLKAGNIATRALMLKKIEPTLSKKIKEVLKKLKEIIEDLKKEKGSESLVKVLSQQINELEPKLPGGPKAQKLAVKPKLALARAIMMGVV